MQRIDELLHLIRNVYFSDFVKRKVLSLELLELATKENNYEVICEAYTSLTQCEYFYSDIESALKYANMSIDLATEHNLEKQLAYAHGIIAPICTKINDESAALDHYHKAITILKKDKQYSRVASMYSNLGALYYNLEDYDKVLQCYDTCDYYIELVKNSNANYSAYDYHKLINRLNTALIYEKQGLYDKIKETIPLLEEYHDTDYYESILQNIIALYVKYYFDIEDYKNFYTYLEKLIKNAKVISYGADVLCDYNDIFDYLIELKDYPNAKILLDIIHDISKEMQSNDILAAYYHRLFVFFKEQNMTDELNKHLDEYFEILLKLDSEMDLIPIQRLKSYLNLENEIVTRTHYQEELDILKRQSAYDALSTLANRNYLNEFAEETFKKCIENKTTYGVIIIDVDNFKHYNDSYGHLAGDYCIMTVARVIKNVAGNHFCARFGGDEFFVITTDIDENQIAKLCSQLKSELKVICENDNDPNIYEPITISQGYYVEVPESYQLLHEFTHNADTALYKSKQNGRNCITKYEPK